MCDWACAESEEMPKQLSSQRIRATVKDALCHGDLILPDKRQLCELWWRPKDGEPRRREYPEVIGE